MIKRKMFYVKKFGRDVWNLRLLVNVLKFKLFLYDFKQRLKLENRYKNVKKKKKIYSTEYKYFFFFFFFRYKKRMEYYRNRFKPFIYRIDLVQKRTRFRRWKKRFLTLRIIKYFYSLLTYKQFRKIGRMAKRKSGLFEHNYLLFLEGRLVNFLYRTGLVETVFKSIYLIKGGFVFINNKSVTFLNELVNIFDFVTFSPLIKIYIYLNYFYKVNHYLILHPPIRCIYLSFIFLFCFFYRLPFSKDLPNRKMIDVYRLTGYPILY